MIGPLAPWDGRRYDDFDLPDDPEARLIQDRELVGYYDRDDHDRRDDLGPSDGPF